MKWLLLIGYIATAKPEGMQALIAHVYDTQAQCNTDLVCLKQRVNRPEELMIICVGAPPT